MAISPCNVDTGVTSIQDAQDQLTDLLGAGSKEALAAINAAATSISEKLSSFKPEINLNPNLQTQLSALAVADPTTKLAGLAAIQTQFGPYVSDLGEILAAVAPDLQEVMSIVSGAVGSDGSVSVASLQSSLAGADFTKLLSGVSGSTFSVSTVCEKCRNIEIQTDVNGNKTAVEPPKASLIPQTKPAPEPVPSLESLRAQQVIIDARRWHRQSEFAARETMDKQIAKQRKELEENGAPKLEIKQLYRRRLAYLSLYYNELGKIIKGDSGGIIDWPWTMKFIAVETIEEKGIEFFGKELTFDFLALVRSYYDKNNDTQYTFEQATQFVYDAASDELKQPDRFKPPLETA